jgi:putative IMPACT (imprinted ancient) family translation regulator
MLQVLLHGGIGEIAVVVSRWFGGTKLGTGGLARAYQDAVQANLASLEVRERVETLRLDAVVDYADADGLHRLLPRHEARIVETRCLDRMTLTLEMPLSEAEPFAAALAGVTGGRGAVLGA